MPPQVLSSPPPSLRSPLLPSGLSPPRWSSSPPFPFVSFLRAIPPPHSRLHLLPTGPPPPWLLQCWLLFRPIEAMGSHQSPVAARSIALLLLLAVVPFTTAELEERKAHIEPANEGGYKKYIIQLERPTGEPGEGQDITGGDADAHRAWHQSFLPSTMTALGKPRLLRSYRTVFTGFAAWLTEEELKEVSAKPGFVRSLPNVIGYLQTTTGPTLEPSQCEG